MPVGIRVIGEGDVEFLAHGDQPRHGVGRGAIHPDPPIPIQGHEAEGRIDGVVDDGRIEAIGLDDGLPEMDAGPAQGIDPDLHAGGADRGHVDDVRQIGDIGADIVVAVDQRRFARTLIGYAPYPLELLLDQRIGGVLDPFGDAGIGRPAARRVVFEAAVLGRVV